MKKHSKSKSSAVPQVDPYLEGVVAKLLERLVGLEKKVDIVIAQTSGKPLGTGDQPNSIQSPDAKQPLRRDRLLYEAICADCHKVCEVPFRPSEDRPVYCKECFAKRKAGGGPGKIFPVLTPVAMPPKIISKPSVATPVTSSVSGTPGKIKKNQPAKKAKKKK